LNLSLSFLFFMLRGTHTPGLAHSALLRVTDLLCLIELGRQAATGSFLAWSTYPLGMKDLIKNET